MTMNAIAIAIGAGAPGIPTPGFSLPLSDSGAGAVNLALGIGSGSATFTRATSATCWGPTGLLLTVGSGVARSTYTELTGSTYLGYLSEEARTNNCIQNRDFTNAAWVKTTMTAAKDQVGIDGAANSASSLLATAGNATAAQTITIAAVNRPFSVYVKRLVGTGNIDLAQDGASFTTQSVANDGLWHRCTLVASQLNPALTIRLATNGDKIAVDYTALEDNGGAAAVLPSTPIATTTVAVTRNKDQLIFPFAGNASAANGTMYVEAQVNSSASTGASRVLMMFSDASGGEVQIMASAGAATTAEMRDGTNILSATGLSNLSTAVRKCVSVWDSTALKMTVFRDGTGKTQQTFDGAMDSTAIGIGCSGVTGSLNLNGTMKNAKLWTVPFTDGQVAGL